MQLSGQGATGTTDRFPAETLGTALLQGRSYMDYTAEYSMQERIVAVGLLTKRDLSLLGPTFDRAWPVEEAPAFSELLRAIDDADRLLKKETDPKRR